LSQSGAIMVYLADKHAAYGGQTDEERHEVLRWLFFDNHKFTSYFATYRFMKAFGTVAPDPTVSKWLRGRIDNAFGIVETRKQEVHGWPPADHCGHVAVRLPVLPARRERLSPRRAVPCHCQVAGAGQAVAGLEAAV
jgi:glutathione S-transferase